MRPKSAGALETASFGNWERFGTTITLLRDWYSLSILETRWINGPPLHPTAQNEPTKQDPARRIFEVLGVPFSGTRLVRRTCRPVAKAQAMFSLMFELFQEATCRSLGADPAIVNARDEGSFPVFPFFLS